MMRFCNLGLKGMHSKASKHIDVKNIALVNDLVSFWTRVSSIASCIIILQNYVSNRFAIQIDKIRKMEE